MAERGEAMLAAGTGELSEMWGVCSSAPTVCGAAPLCPHGFRVSGFTASYLFVWQQHTNSGEGGERPVGAVQPGNALAVVQQAGANYD